MRFPRSESLQVAVLLRGNTEIEAGLRKHLMNANTLAVTGTTLFHLGSVNVPDRELNNLLPPDFPNPTTAPRSKQELNHGQERPLHRHQQLPRH